MPHKDKRIFFKTANFSPSKIPKRTEPKQIKAPKPERSIRKQEPEINSSNLKTPHHFIRLLQLAGSTVVTFPLQHTPHK